MDTVESLQWYRDKPEIGVIGHWYIAAFWDLHTHRRSWDPLSPIPRGDIRDFALEHGMVADEVSSFVHVIRQLDAQWLEEAADEIERKRQTIATPSATPSRGGGRMRNG